MRPTLEQTFLKVAQVISERGTCARRKVGCVLTDIHGNILSTGYNGNARGLAHCIDTPCAGAAEKAGTSTSLYLCEAIHAEQNALLQCKDNNSIHTCFVTCSPCIQCTKLLLQTSCKRVCFLERSSHEAQAGSLWCKSRSLYMLGVGWTWQKDGEVPIEQ